MGLSLLIPKLFSQGTGSHAEELGAPIPYMSIPRNNSTMDYCPLVHIFLCRYFASVIMIGFLGDASFCSEARRDIRLADMFSEPS